MIDSLNFLVRDVRWIDFKRLNRLGIYYKKFLNKQKNGYKCLCYSFDYKGIKFIFNIDYQIVIIIANAHIVLNKTDITVKDRIEYELRLQKILQVIFNTKNIKYELNRIDYCIDIKVYEVISYLEGKDVKKFIPADNDMKIYHYLLWYGLHSYRYMKQDRVYGTSIYLKTKRGTKNFIIYDRYAKTKNEKDKGFYRIEVQLKSKFLKSKFKKEGITKDLDNYWSESAMTDYYFKFLHNFFNEGDYYKLYEGKRLIDKSDNTTKMKHKLIKFREDIILFTLDNLLKPKFCKEANKFNRGRKIIMDYGCAKIIKRINLKYSYAKIKNYIERLDEIGVNPISIIDYNGGRTNRKSLPNLLKLARGIAEEKYFK